MLLEAKKALFSLENEKKKVVSCYNLLFYYYFFLAVFFGEDIACPSLRLDITVPFYWVVYSKSFGGVGDDLAVAPSEPWVLQACDFGIWNSGYVAVEISDIAAIAAIVAIVAAPAWCECECGDGQG